MNYKNKKQNYFEAGIVNVFIFFVIFGWLIFSKLGVIFLDFG